MSDMINPEIFCYVPDEKEMRLIARADRIRELEIARLGLGEVAAHLGDWQKQAEAEQGSALAPAE